MNDPVSPLRVAENLQQGSNPFQAQLGGLHLIAERVKELDGIGVGHGVKIRRYTTIMKRETKPGAFDLKIELDRETDGRWIADIPVLPGVTVYGRTRKQAVAAVEALALRVIADRLEHGEAVPGEIRVSFAA